MDRIATESTIPVFAVIGHPNEGKSAVLSTLAEDDSVRVSPIPGETTRCHVFPVRLDGREIIRFIDTPGFQNPRQTLAWLQERDAAGETGLNAFIRAHRHDPDFADDCELLGPVAAGAGVIFVVDGSRPVRNVDRAEMEILRLSGAPRMAVINAKEANVDFLNTWREEFRRHFNSVRMFNANRATYAERIELLESLRFIDQELEPILSRVVSGFKRDWVGRNHRSAAIIVRLLGQAISYRRSIGLDGKEDEEQLRRRLYGEYTRFLTDAEAEAHNHIRALFKHNIFQVDLPEQSILQEDLFSERTWKFLGLSRGQLILAGALGGAALGAGIDVSTAGISMGVFSTIGGLVGAVGTALKGKQLASSVRVLGLRAGGEVLEMGPVKNIQLLYILIDRALLYYGFIINWAHGRRDYRRTSGVDGLPQGQGYTSGWSMEEKGTAARFFQAMTKEDAGEQDRAAADLAGVIEQQLLLISEDRGERERFAMRFSDRQAGKDAG